MKSCVNFLFNFLSGLVCVMFEAMFYTFGHSPLRKDLAMYFWFVFPAIFHVRF